MYFDPNKTIGALGTLIAAKWCKTRNPQHLLISLDSVDARRWMNLDDDGKRADMLGLTISDGKPILDILEVKAGEDARHVYNLSQDGKLTGKPINQLLNTFRSIAGIFGLNELKHHILTPPRREILRNHFYRQGFSGHRSPSEKQVWGDHLNSLFAGEVSPDIRLNLVDAPRQAGGFMNPYAVLHARATIEPGPAAWDLLDRLAKTYIGPDEPFPAPRSDGYIVRYEIRRIGGVGPWA